MRRASLLAVALALACAGEPPPPNELALARAWRSETFAGCLLASPLEHGGQVIVASGDGRIAALDPSDGTTAWSIDLPEVPGRMAHVIATPVIAGDRMIVAWQMVADPSPDPAATTRFAHHAAVIDLARGAIDADFPIVELAATRPSVDGTGDVVFSPGNALSRSRLVHATTPDHPLGLAYVSLGNARDVQPWHGWMFELDLDAWHAGGVPISSVLLTTPTTDCGPPGGDGSRDMRCGGGIWAPAGPLLLDDGDSFELVVPTGNGVLDVEAGLYAHTLMRIRGPGLAFDAGCDAAACAGFDALAPARACLESCDDLFVPRLRDGDPPFDAPGCEGLSFFGCYAALDWDLGADTPARVELSGGRAALVLPAKDGGVYLIDAAHLGTMLDRVQLVRACGQGGARCDADWAGMMVTQPAIVETGSGTLAIVATFMPGERHPAGLVGVRVIDDPAGPRLEVAWQEPSFSTDAATRAFRRHPSGVRVIDVGGAPHAVVIEQGRLGEAAGVIHVVRAEDGHLAARAELGGPGQRYSVPLAIGGTLAIATCDQGNSGPGWIEGWTIEPR